MAIPSLCRTTRIRPADDIRRGHGIRRAGVVMACLLAVSFLLATASSGRAESPRGRWTFFVTSPVTAEGPIVYLRDVLRPLDPELPAWSRLSRSPVGLLPSDGGPMVIRRDRLAHAIRASEATTTRIDIEGPDRIEVRRDPSANPGDAETSQPLTDFSGRGTTAPRRNVGPIGDGGVVQAGSVTELGNVKRGSVIELDPVTRDRLARRIEIAVRQGDDGVGERFDVDVPADQAGLAALADARRIRSVRFLEAAAAGVRPVLVEGDTAEGPIEAELRVRLDAYPEAVASRAALRRGHLIAAGDLMLVPVPPERWHDAYVGSTDSLLGQEVANPVRSGQPIRLGDVRRPILVRRGDLVVVRVNGGGVTVTTNAKSLGEGGKMDLIQVETFDPKRKLIARVVDPGRVEVISRTPRTSP